MTEQDLTPMTVADLIDYLRRLKADSAAVFLYQDLDRKPLTLSQMDDMTEDGGYLDINVPENGIDELLYALERIASIRHGGRNADKWLIREMRYLARTALIKVKSVQSAQYIPIQSLTEEQAREWLIANDQEASEFWRDSNSGGLVEAVRENLADFGQGSQLGSIIVINEVAA